MAAIPGVTARGVSLLWRDRQGRLSGLKALAFACTLAPGVVLAARWMAHDLGASAVTEAMDDTGLWSIRFLLLAFAVSPIKRLANWPRVAGIRRMLGVAAMCYGLAHLLLYALDQNFRLGVIVGEIVQRLYLTFGFVALVGLAVLGGTSTDAWIRRLGRNWKRLHLAVYVLIPLACLHFFMWSKVVSSEAVLVTGIFLWLAAWRAVPRDKQDNLAVLVALGLTVAAATVVGEFAWYRVVTSIRAERVLLANLDVSDGFSPGVWVALLSLGVVVLVRLRKALSHR